MTKELSLIAIEGLCLVAQENCENLENLKNTIDLIYKLAHIHGDCENPHEDWHKEGISILINLHAAGVI